MTQDPGRQFLFDQQRPQRSSYGAGKSEGFFEEYQKLDQAFIWLLGFETLVLMIIFLVADIPWWTYAIIGVITAPIMLFMINMKLHVMMDEMGVHYEMSPFFFGKKESISWNEIESINVRKFAGFMENSGYGKKRHKNKVVYRLEGSQAIEITMKDGKKIIFSTRKGKNLSELISRSVIK